MITKRQPTRLTKSGLNSAGSHHCGSLIGAGDVDKSSAWSFSAEDGDKLLGANGDDWTVYAQWFLGEDTSATAGTKDRYKYPFGKGGKVFRSALIAIRSRASQQGDTAIFDAAGHFVDQIDGTKSYEGQKALPMQMRMWSKIEKTSIDEDQRILTGIATTPSSDRMQDIVEPLGADYDLPIPFLWQHDDTQPIGEVTSAKPTKNGIPVTIQIAKTDTPGTLKDRLDEAWESIKIGLVKGLSIGFAPTEYSFMEDGGIHFLEWEWLELSAVTIPANAEASILTIKSADDKAVKKQAVRIQLKKAARVSIKLSREVPMGVKSSKPPESDHVMAVAGRMRAAKLREMVDEDLIVETKIDVR